MTPREVFRLMGVKDRDYDKIADFSDASLYKLAGNSIVIQVLMGIFGELLGMPLWILEKIVKIFYFFK